METFRFIKDPKIEAAHELKKELEQFMRNGRFGACGDCPTDSDGKTYPEMCEFTIREDHQMGLEEIKHQFELNVEKFEQIRQRQAAKFFPEL